MKQVIIVNESLKMPRGKLAAQVAHASVGAFVRADEAAAAAWIKAGMPKIVLACEGAKQLLNFWKVAQSEHLPSELVRDAGKTVLPAGSATCVGIGPATDNAIDALTHDLSLVR